VGEGAGAHRPLALSPTTTSIPHAFLDHLAQIGDGFGHGDAGGVERGDFILGLAAAPRR
jgi:hypothetical protein